MTVRFQGVLSTTLRLSIAERAELAAELLAVLDDESDEDVKVAWATEIVQRINKVRESGSSGRDWREVVRELRDSKS